MRMIVNGVVFDNPEQIDIRFEVDPAGEEVGRMVFTTSGGVLRMRPGTHLAADASIHFTAENDGCLLLGDGSTLGDERKKENGFGLLLSGAGTGEGITAVIGSDSSECDEPIIAH